MYKQITIQYAAPRYPVFTTSEVPAKLLLGQKTVTVTIFIPLNLETEQIK